MNYYSAILYIQLIIIMLCKQIEIVFTTNIKPY